jgi:hypothetical protein
VLSENLTAFPRNAVAPPKPVIVLGVASDSFGDVVLCDVEPDRQSGGQTAEIENGTAHSRDSGSTAPKNQ